MEVEHAVSIINLTSHPISFYNGNGEKIVVKTSGREARCSIKDEIIERVTVISNGRKMEVPVFRSYLTASVTGLPEPLVKDGTPCRYCDREECGDERTGIRNCEYAPRYIVSRVIVDALPERSDLYSPYELIRENGSVIGAKALSKS